MVDLRSASLSLEDKCYLAGIVVIRPRADLRVVRNGRLSIAAIGFFAARRGPEGLVERDPTGRKIAAVNATGDTLPMNKLTPVAFPLNAGSCRYCALSCLARSPGYKAR